MSSVGGGQVVTRNQKSGRSFALRFLAYGERCYQTLGSERDGWTKAKAQVELQNVLADVRRGLWVPPDRRIRPTNTDGDGSRRTKPVIFDQFASDRLHSRRGEVSERTYRFEEWALDLHLMPYFSGWALEDIDIEAVDDYRRFKVQQSQLRREAIESGEPLRDKRGYLIRPLSPGTINRTIDILRSILELAVEYRHISSNPAAGRRRRLKTTAKRPVHLDSVHQIEALLDAATDLDQNPDWTINDRRANIAGMLLAGPRAQEHCSLLWRDVDLENNRLEIGRSKTDAGLREIHLLPLLRNELLIHRERSPYTRPDDPVFPTSQGNPRDVSCLRSRILVPALARADELLTQRGHAPLPGGVTPHKLRHTFASILVACGEDPASVMAQLGHTDPKFTLRVYTHLMRRNPTERARLKAFVYAETPRLLAPAQVTPIEPEVIAA